MHSLARFEVALIQSGRASFDVALVQARRASECISMGVVMHLLAPRACIENALHFEIPGEIQ